MRHTLIQYKNDEFVVIEISNDMTNFRNNFSGMLFFDRNLFVSNHTRSILLSKKVASQTKKIIGKISEINDEEFKKNIMLNDFYIKDWLVQSETSLFLFPETDKEFKKRQQHTPDDLLILKIIPKQN